MGVERNGAYGWRFRIGARGTRAKKPPLNSPTYATREEAEREMARYYATGKMPDGKGNRRTIYRCGACGTVGHTAKTCPFRVPARVFGSLGQDREG